MLTMMMLQNKGRDCTETQHLHKTCSSMASLILLWSASLVPCEVLKVI